MPAPDMIGPYGALLADACGLAFGQEPIDRRIGRFDIVPGGEEEFILLPEG
jgi:hypothetical protein